MADGIFTDAIVRRAQGQLAADPAFDPSFDQLFDLSGVTSFDVSDAFLRGLGSTSIFSADSYRALVTSDNLGYGLARMFATWNDTPPHSRFMVFRDREAALHWLASPR
ncbi:MAG: hypothetical protein JWM35_528 [Verrucomicrobia bacterium]|nr:hypothetical protein [Verrucomicrobiota bacterium]